MDSGDMQILIDAYVRILKKGRSVYKNANNANTLQTAQYLETYSTYLSKMNDKLKNILSVSDDYANECIAKAIEIRTNIDINDKYKDNPLRMILAHKEMYSGMSWADLTDLEDAKKGVLKNVSRVVKKPININKYEYAPIIYKDISHIYEKNIGIEYKIPIINNLNEMPSSLYWYKGDKSNPPGIYICLSRKFYAQVPFPNVIDGTRDFNRACSIKCKYTSEQECLKIREDLSQRYNSEIRECRYAHSGDKYTKIGTSLRCPNIPRFGNHSFLKEDLENLPEYDMKMMLMHSLSDILLSSLWFQKQKNTNLVFTNIDTC